jgi:hypothetical protein
VAPPEADQLSVGVSETPVAPFEGEGFEGIPGTANVVNDQVAELVLPAPFLATTSQ